MDQYIVDENGQVTVDLTKGFSIVSAEQYGILIDLNKGKPVVLNAMGIRGFCPIDIMKATLER